MGMITLRKNNLNNPLDDFRNQFERIFEEAFLPKGVFKYDNDLSSNWYPSVEAFENDDKYILKAELPGIPKENINIEVQENVVTFSGERNYHNEVNQDNLYKNEISYGHFSRTFNLAKAIDVDKVDCDFKDGLLTINLPKKEEEKTKTKTIKL